ncbi:hypothetical protein ACV3OB_15160 [Clostridium perfringens]|uniref:hypothetical protein n=1 Tax=Clostridium perfringens TaxID=1502 RepID=UPI0022452AA0|nr:hypothetical protein [Clostridium perfringens]ELC8332916.1 hypothetical protein [Clostridium perfringens]MCX0386755.1 hypothetical protein [Clostridium perfringens]
MIDMTYEDALNIIDNLINELEDVKGNKEFKIKNKKERYLIIDALSLLETKLEKELIEKRKKI